MNIYTYEHMNENDTCEVKRINKENVKNLKSHMLNEKVLLTVADNFKIFSDPTRLKILQVLYQKELCVCDLAATLEGNQSTISHQLRILRSKNMVKYRKIGKMAYYSLADEHVVKIIQMGIEHATEKR